MTPFYARSATRGRGRRAPRLVLLVGSLLSALVMAASAGASPGTGVRHLYGIAQIGSASELIPFDVGSTGGLTERQDHTVPVPYAARSLVVGRNGRTVYVGSTQGFDNNDDLIPGTIKVYAVAADGSLTLLQTVAAPPRQMLITPDGTRLIEWDDYGLVVSFPIQPDGSLGAARPNPSVTGSARALAVTPDGSTLYVATYPQQLEQYAIGANGALSALIPAELGLYGCRADFLGVTPDGTQLDATCYSQAITLSLAPGGGLTFNGSLFSTWGGSPNVEDVRGRGFYKAIFPNALEHLQRQPDGTLLDFPTPLIFNPDRLTSIAADPGGSLLAVATTTNKLETYGINADGSLSPGPLATIATTRNALSLLTYAPDQPPIADLKASRDGSTVHFDASASAAVNGTVARYDWTFGDGTVLVDGGPAPTHAYAGLGEYTATMTLTDSAGCSVAEVFTGMMSICAGSTDAATSMLVHVTADAGAPPVSPPPAAPLPSAPPPPSDAPPTERPLPPTLPETLVVPRSLTGTPTLRGGRVHLAWTPAPGAPPSKRYLVSWSPLHSSQGPADPLMRRTWTTSTHMLMPGARPGTTLHYAVYAYGSDGVLVKAGKTTIRLPHSRSATVG